MSLTIKILIAPIFFTMVLLGFLTVFIGFGIDYNAIDLVDPNSSLGTNLNETIEESADLSNSVINVSSTEDNTFNDLAKSSGSFFVSLPQNLKRISLIMFEVLDIFGLPGWIVAGSYAILAMILSIVVLRSVFGRGGV